MDIKKRIPKFMPLLLSFAMAFSSVIPAYAMETTNNGSTAVIDGETISSEERNLEDVTVTYKQASSFFVTIPKTIVLDGWKQSAYSVKVSGDIGAGQCVYAAPVDGIPETENIDFYMEDQASVNAKADVAADVTHKKSHWTSAEAAEGYAQKDNLVSAPDLTAGVWKGIFQMEIKLEDHSGHTHEYADGICTACGGIDPSHAHSYTDGVCTICGEEADPYGTAPAEAYINWDYALDDTDGTITLNYYTGSETDVIVYANYVVNGKTYKAQLAGNAEGAKYSTPYMFNGHARTNCKNIKTIKFSGDIDTSNVTDMGYMFYWCSSLTSLDLGSFDTSNVTNMGSMFYNCQSLTSLDVSGFETGKVTDMGYMFYLCKSLTRLDLGGFETGNVTDMHYMFYNCNKLTRLDVGSFETGNVTDMSWMFCLCTSLTSLDLGGFDTGKVTDMGMMFNSCYTLTSLDLGSFNTVNVRNMGSMFSYCPKLKTVYVTNGKWSASQANVSDMFKNCGTSSVTYK